MVKDEDNAFPRSRYLRLEVVDQVWARNAESALDADEALALAHAELQNFRAARSSPAA